MKILFINEDGTIKRNLVVGIVAVVLVILAGLYLQDDVKALLHNNRIAAEKKRTTTKFNMCQDCDINFKEKEITLNIGEVINIKEIIKLKNINIKNVEFEVADEEIIKISSSGSDAILEALNTTGSTTLVAKYYEKVARVKVNVVYQAIEKAELRDTPYQVALGEMVSLEVNTKPLGIDIKKLDLSIKDKNIAYLDEEMRIVPVSLGNTEVVLNFNGVITTQVLSVVQNRIMVYALEDNSYVEVSKLDTKELGNEFDIVIQYQDNLSIGYREDHLTIEVINNGMITDVSYDGINLEKERFFNYKVKVSEKDSNLESVSSLIKISLPDGSSTEITVLG